MMVWQDHAANEWSTSIQRCLAPDELEPIVSKEGLDPFSLGDPIKVERILTEAGFAETSFIDVCEPVYDGENVDVAIEWVRRFLFVRELLQRLDAASAERALGGCASFWPHTATDRACGSTHARGSSRPGDNEAVPCLLIVTLGQHVLRHACPA